MEAHLWRIHALKLPFYCPIAELEGDASRAHHRPARLRRSASFSAYETLHGVWTAKDVIQSAGYPMEPHIVTTSDGYIMQMERIPRRGDFSASALWACRIQTNHNRLPYRTISSAASSKCTSRPCRA